MILIPYLRIKYLPHVLRLMRAGKCATIVLGCFSLALVIYWLTNPVQAIRTFESIGYWQNWDIRETMIVPTTESQEPTAEVTDDFPNP